MSHATLHRTRTTDPHRTSVVGSAVLGFLSAFVVGAAVIVTLLITSFAQGTEGYPGLDVPGVVDTRIDHGSVVTQIGPGGVSSRWLPASSSGSSWPSSSTRGSAASRTDPADRPAARA